MAMLRSEMTALVYRKLLSLHIDTAREFGAVSLASSDVDSVVEYFHGTICDTWADALQLGPATWFLAAQLEATQKRINFTTKI
ncbi:hypothetical protein ETB97_008181 [Aspergillus alliaceus]|uniref:Uncharacterized protein n=1 Tax=Petromyces alliaceus TaxID=209559 RepID=A0A8H5ZX43_PETAA|nr:hypothetical protein ETB97_008181 [Aspergillus burnettii]